MKKPFVDVPNVANGDLVVEPPDRAWFPQRIPVIEGRELLPVNVVGLISWHEERKLGEYVLVSVEV